MSDKPKQFVWSFYYHKGPAPKTGLIEASTEHLAMLVSTRWCLLNNCRPPASVQPMILADESILQVPFGPEEPEFPGAVEATTAVNSK